MDTLQTLLDQAVDAGNRADFAEAEALLRRASEAAPNHPVPKDSLAKLLLEQSRTTEAVTLLKQALELDPGNGQRWLRYTDALLRAGHAAQALTVLQNGQQKGLKGPLVDQFIIQAKDILAAAKEAQPIEQMIAAGKAADAVKKLQQRFDNGLKPNGPLRALMGQALVQAGRASDALPWLEQALDAMPQNAGLWYQYAQALQALGKRDEVHEAYLKLVDLVPLQPGIYTNMSGNLNDAQRFREALVWANKGLQLVPEDQGLRINKAIALFEEEEHDEAEAMLDALLEEGFENDMSLFLQARLLKEQGFPSEALKVYRQLIDNGTPEISLALHMGRAETEMGQFDQALDRYQQSIEHFPEFAPAWASIAHARKMTPEDAQWRNKVLELVDKVEHEQVLSGLHYALGKFFDDIKEHANAFNHYQQANELKKQYWPDSRYQDDKQHALIDQLIAAYSRACCHSIHDGASNSARPLFIVGMPRSGTSLTEQILASHPSIFGAGELRFWPRMVQKYPEITRHARFTPAWLNATAEACLAHLDRRNTGAERVVDKMPGNFHNVGLIHAVFPNARILHTMRNPVDTCLSIYFQNFNKGHTYASDLQDLADYYRHYHRLMHHWRNALPRDSFLELPYEQLVDDQEGWSRRIMDFIGLDWDARMLSFYKTERKVGTASNWQARQPIYKTSKERWRHYEAFVGPLLPLLDLYDPERGQIVAGTSS